MDAETTAAPSCYRHPGRQTRLSCSECSKPICGECSRDAAVGQRCPECAGPANRTRVVTAQELRTPSVGSAPISYGIMGVAVVLFFLGLSSTEWDLRLLRNLAQVNFLVDDGEWYRIITAAGLHANITHIAFNMYALYLFGPRLEREAGSVPFALLFAAGAAAGGAAFFVLGDLGALAVGASGAIFALFGVWLAATYRTRHTPFGQAMFNQLVFLLAINAALPLFIRNIAWEAHAGGLVAGIVIGLSWGKWAAGKPNAVAIRSAIAIAVLAASIAVVLVA